MRTRFLLLIAAVCAACERPATPPAAPRAPVGLLVRAGELIRAEYVDSALMASADPWPEAQARARELWLRYGSAGMDSVAILVSNRAAPAPGLTMGTSFFHFVPDALGRPADSVPASATDPSRPVELEMRAGYVRAVYVDSVLLAGPSSPDQNARMLALGRQVLRQLGAPADSVQIAITDGAVPERRRVWSTFPVAVLHEP